jgi:hypothetical protein
MPDGGRLQSQRARLEAVNVLPGWEEVIQYLYIFLTLKTLIYEGTNGMKPLVTEFVM